MDELDHLDDSVEETVLALVAALSEAAERGRLRVALRALEAYELRLCMAAIFAADDAAPVGSPERRAADLLMVDAEIERLRRAV